NIQSTSKPSTLTYVHAEENNDNQAEEEHVQDDEFTNPFCTSVQGVAESSSHNIGNSKKQISEMQVSRERSTGGRVKTQALETALSQLKAQLASGHIQLNSYKAENKTLSQRYEELAKSNM
nr:hypothetical protein [Tanacetum cinerariifolium]